MLLSTGTQLEEAAHAVQARTCYGCGATRATFGARNGGAQGLPLPIACVPVNKLHFGVPFQNCSANAFPESPHTWAQNRPAPGQLRR